MRMQDYGQMLRDGWVLLLLGALLGALAGAGLWALSPRTYSSEATLQLGLAEHSDPSASFQVSEYVRDQLVTYGEIAQLPVVLEPAAARLDDGTTPRQLADMVSVDVPSESFLLTVTASDEDPQRAAAAAAAVGEELTRTIEDTAARDGGRPLVSVRTVQDAAVPVAPDGAALPVWAGGAGALGLILGLLLAWLRFAGRAERGTRAQHLARDEAAPSPRGATAVAAAQRPIDGS